MKTGLPPAVTVKSGEGLHALGDGVGDDPAGAAAASSNRNNAENKVEKRR